MSNLLPGERIDELQRNGYRIIQNPERFCFGMDAVLLSGFARAKKQERCLDTRSYRITAVSVLEWMRYCCPGLRR